MKYDSLEYLNDEQMKIVRQSIKIIKTTSMTDEQLKIFLMQYDEHVRDGIYLYLLKIDRKISKKVNNANKKITREILIKFRDVLKNTTSADYLFQRDESIICK